GPPDPAPRLRRCLHKMIPEASDRFAISAGTYPEARAEVSADCRVRRPSMTKRTTAVWSRLDRARRAAYLSAPSTMYPVRTRPRAVRRESLATVLPRATGARVG